MMHEIHIVVATSREATIAKIELIAGGRAYSLISSGYRSRVSFQDLDDHTSGYDRSTEKNTMYCAVARVAD
jgi:hypothetical protein